MNEEITDEAIQELLTLIDTERFPLVDDPEFVEYLKNRDNKEEVEAMLRRWYDLQTKVL